MITQKKENFTPPKFKVEALRLAEKTSLPSATKGLGLKEFPLYTRHTSANGKRVLLNVNQT